jgi:GAF domain-containing protein
MPEERSGDTGDPQATIARQAAEIERLQRQLEEYRFVEDLRDALSLGTSASAIAAPQRHSQLLEMIVQTAAQVIHAKAASLFTIDEERRELIFEVALGQKAEEVRKFRVPLGHGIAGLVAATGQAMAISDAQSDPRHASEIAESVGYKPQSILCVPLSRDGEVTGVLELLDKEGAPSFTAADMEALGLFANLAAVAIEQSRMHGNLLALLNEAIRSPEPRGGSQQRLRERARAFVASIEGDPAYQRALEISALVQEITAYGEDETVATRSILRGFAGYLRARVHPLGEFGGIP